MSLIKYNIDWTGIDAGREGLWTNPVWFEVLEIIKEFEGESVYNPKSPIYVALEERFPDSKWRSKTPEGKFRPLFRDYPNSWTRTGVVSLDDQIFSVTPLGNKVLSGETKREEVLNSMFFNHTEIGPDGSQEKPFLIILEALEQLDQLVSVNQIYWVVMKNFRPGSDTIEEASFRAKFLLTRDIPPTPFRRIRNMLSLLRGAGRILSYRRSDGVLYKRIQ